MLKLFRAMQSAVKLDGGLGEGGGQVLRIGLSLSALYGIPIEIENIRANRPKPGLAAQHLTGVKLVKEMCNAQVKGDYIGSTSLEFIPGALNGNQRTFTADTKTAGAITLLAQTALPCALFFPCNGPVTLNLLGGTNVPMAPHIEYLTEIFRSLLNRFGADFNFSVVRRGYYPKGGGNVQLHIKPVKSLNAITLNDPGIPCEIVGSAYVAGHLRASEAQKIAHDAENTLTRELRQQMKVPPISISGYKENNAVGPASGINIKCNTTTGCVLGSSSLYSREVSNPGIEAAQKLCIPLKNKSCVDQNTQDQMIILMALAKGTSRVNIGHMELTSHTKTAIQVVEKMLSTRGVRFTVSENKTEGSKDVERILECEGSGLLNTFC